MRLQWFTNRNVFPPVLVAQVNITIAHAGSEWYLIRHARSECASSNTRDEELSSQSMNPGRARVGVSSMRFVPKMPGVLEYRCLVWLTRAGALFRLPEQRHFDNRSSTLLAGAGPENRLVKDLDRDRRTQPEGCRKQSPTVSATSHIASSSRCGSK